MSTSALDPSTSTQSFLTLRQIQEAELQILIAFQEFCNQNGLFFSLCGGSLLGAVRHQGFIPWDDDIDVNVPRGDFERLLKMSQEGVEIGRYRIVPCCVSDDVADSSYLKIVDPTIATHEAEILAGHNGSLWIDVIPMDGVSGDDAEWADEYDRATKLRRIASYANVRPLGAAKKWKALLRWPVVMYVQAFHRAGPAEKKLTALAKSRTVDESTHVACVTKGLYGLGERVVKEDYFSTVPVQFEGQTMMVMSCWDSYLHGIYGDYMQIPPENKRHTHDLLAWPIDNR
jgi:lipopolysaccharide cholinephosphotransferase